MDSMAYFIIYSYGIILIGLTLSVLSIYALILVIRALKIYIKKNSNI